MRFHLFFCLIFLFAQISIAQSNDFYDTVLERVAGASPKLIALDIDSDTYKGRAIIENVDLYVFLKRTKGLDETAYKSLMKDLLVNKKKLCLYDTKIETERFIPIREFKEVNDYAAKGEKEFLKHYFSGRLMKGEFIENTKSFDVMYAVANKLFEWQIATYVADTSGLLAIWDYENLK